MTDSRKTRRLRAGLYGVTAVLAGGVVAGPLTTVVATAIDPPTATVTGAVFDDRDGDGQRDGDEPGIPDVQVSDGQQVVRTDAEGRYTLEASTDRRRQDLVFVTQPAGWSVGTDEFMTARFWRDLGQLERDQEATADFALTADERSTTSSFTFGNVADPHVNGNLADQIVEINGSSEDIAFIQVSGDLTNNATDVQFNRYKAATAGSDKPVWPAVGNHEYSGGSSYAARIDNYRRHVGPEWYSFDYGNRHFLVLENNGAAPFEEQLEWARADLAANVGDKELVVLTHQPMNVPFGSNAEYDAYGDLLEQYGVQLILVGHEHSNDADLDSEFAPDAKHVQTASSSYTIDNAPRGFRYVHMEGEEFTNPFRMYGQEQALVVTSPADGTDVPVDGFPGIAVNVYDTNNPAVAVRYRVDGRTWFDMTSTGGTHTWTGPLQTKDRPNPPVSGAWVAPGEHTIDVEATDAAGETWSTTTTFTVTRDAATAPRAGADWAQHGGSATHAGVAEEPVEAGQQLAWMFQTEGVFLTGSPTIVDGVVYAATRDEDGEGNAAVHAVRVEDGKELWSHELPISVHGSIAVADGTVYAATLRSELYALDAETGEERWTYGPEAAPEPYNQRMYGYYGVTVADGKVLFPYQTRHGKASRGLLVALEPADGSVVWEAALQGATMSDGTPAVADGKVFVGSQTADRIVAFDLATGEQLWVGANVLGGWQDGIPSAAGGRVFIGSNNAIVARDADTGEELWRYRSPHGSKVSSGSTPSAPAVRGDVVYMGFPSGAVTALDARTGAVLWDRLLPGGTYTGGVHSSPAVAGDTLFVGSNNGSMYALDSRTGQPLWEHEIGAWVAAGPAVSGNTVVAGAYDGNLYAWVPGGEAAQRWATVTGTVTDPITGEPVDGAKVTLTGADGTVVATTSTVSDGTFTVAADAGTYEVAAARRGYVAGGTTEVTLGDTGETEVGLELTEVTGPVAGVTDVAPDYGTVSTRTDVVAGDTYHYVMNDRVQASIVERLGANNQPGTFREGWLADIMLTDATAMETLDWSEMVLTPTMNDPRRPWNRSGEWLDLPEVSVDGTSVVAAGHAQVDPALETSVTYETLPGAPVVKMQLEVTNTGSTDFEGYFQYLLDPDSSQDVVQVPGVAGTNPGFLTSGWAGNWIYDGASTANGQPAHGIAWVEDEPTGLSAFGYIMGASFDASVAAGGTRTVTWYHITDYPGTGAAASNVAHWASQLSVLDDDVADRALVRGTVTDEAGDPLAGQLVEAVDGAGEVVQQAWTLDDGAYAMALPSGSYTVRAAGLGYASASTGVTLTTEPVTADLVLGPVVVDATTGLRLTGSLVEGGGDDIVLQNSRLAMSVATGGNDPQLSGSTVGKVRDLAMQGEADQIDWLNLPYVTATQPTGTEAWQQLQVVSTSVEVVERTAERAVVRVTGASAEDPAIQVVTDYVIEPDQPWVTATTTYRNTASAATTVWVGDALDHDGSGQHSLVAGHPAITAPYSAPAAYEPTGSWVGASGNDGQAYGLLYAGGSGELTAYGNGNWIMSQLQVVIV